MIHINYHNITHDDMNNGDGLRVVLWVSGCSHRCYNCQNPQTWDYLSGIPFGVTEKKEIFEELSKDYISGITFSGGDPLFDLNLDEVLSLINKIRASFPTKTIWLYTGYNFDDLKRRYDEYKYTPYASYAGKFLTRWEIISKVDVLVDGEYIDEQRDTTLKWRGSKNQRVIDVQRSLKEEKIIKYTD